MKKYLLIFAVFFVCILSASAAENSNLCPVCRIEFASPAWPVTENASITTAIDGRQLGIKLPPLPECPLCGGVFGNHEFSQDEIRKLEKIIWSGEFQQQRQSSSRARLALLKQKLGRNSLELAQSWLEVAWAEQAEQKTHALQKSAEFFESYLISQGEHHEETEIRLKLADIYRQLGKFALAEKTLKNISAQAESNFTRVLKLEQQLIAEQKTSAIAVPDGNRLHQAIHSNDLPACMKLVEQKKLLNETDLNGRTPLLLATELQNLAALEIIVRAGADLTRKNRAGMSAPQLAARNEFARGLALMLKAGIDIRQRDPGGNNLLHLACAGSSSQREAMVKMLLARNIDINQRNFSDLTPLHIVTASGSRAMLELLQKNGAKIDARLPDGSSALFICRNELIAPLIELGADIQITSNRGLTAFATALLNGDRARIGEFKKTGRFGIDLSLPQNHSERLFWQTVELGKIDTLAALLAKNPNLVKLREIGLGESALHRAVLLRRHETVQILLQNGADPDIGNDFARTPLHYAAMQDDIRLVKLLTDAGADVLALDIRGSTALHEAAAAGASDIYQLLISLGASDSTKNNAGLSAAELRQNHESD